MSTVRYGHRRRVAVACPALTDRVAAQVPGVRGVGSVPRVTRTWTRFANSLRRRLRRGAPARGPVQAVRSGDTHAPVGVHRGPVRPAFDPHPDGRADPGEVVWTWVPYEDDPRRGKDRPVLVVGRDGDAVLALIMTSKDHDLDAADEARWGRVWMDVGAGAWDPQRRPSEVRLDRVLRLDPTAIRREGAVMSRARFEEVARSLVGLHGW